MFHPHWRQHALAELDDPFDVVVIGGGITGCGILFDASQRGLRVLLLEKQDIASGTSSRSSKLIHGGLRYLKQMQFRVTRTAAAERDRLIVLNPSLVRPIRFVYPANRGDELPGWTVDLGLWMYDRLTNRPEKHSHLDVGEVEEMLPGMATTNLEQAFAYTDALTDDAQLTLAVAATGFAYGGLVLTRAEAIELTESDAGRIDGVVFRDLATGAAHRVKAQVVVNATGVWVDELRQRHALGDPRLRPSRGVHLVLPVERLRLRCAAMVPSPDDGRPVFLIPHTEGVLVGTTDIYHQGSLEDPRPTGAEVDYLLRTLSAHFPEHPFQRTDVRGVFAGLRPILDSHTDNPSAASREEDIWEERGLISVAGGKLTTWRPTAEEAVDEIVQHLPEERSRQASACHTEGTPLAGLAPLDLPRRLSDGYGLDAALAAALASRLRAQALWAPSLARDANELRPLVEGTDLCAAEVRAHLRFGAVVRLEDLLLRRARFGLWDPQAGRRLAPALRTLFEQELGWDAQRWETELEAYQGAAQAWSPEGIAESA